MLILFSSPSRSAVVQPEQEIRSKRPQRRLECVHRVEGANGQVNRRYQRRQSRQPLRDTPATELARHQRHKHHRRAASQRRQQAQR
jgi:hypothetical protein